MAMREVSQRMVRRMGRAPHVCLCQSCSAYFHLYVHALLVAGGLLYDGEEFVANTSTVSATACSFLSSL